MNRYLRADQARRARDRETFTRRRAEAAFEATVRCRFDSVHHGRDYHTAHAEPDEWTHPIRRHHEQRHIRARRRVDLVVAGGLQ